MVCRPGGSTSAELAVLGVPAILVPLPNAPNDHQRRNAEVLMKAGLATLVEDAELDGQRLSSEIDRMLNEFKGSGDPDGERHRRSVGYPNATRNVADLVLTHASGEQPPTDRKAG